MTHRKTPNELSALSASAGANFRELFSFYSAVFVSMRSVRRKWILSKLSAEIT